MLDASKVRAFTLIMALGTFVVVMDNTIMNVSIQALVADLNTTVSGVQAAIALNALMMAAFVLFGGKMADIIGQKKAFMSGVVIYIIGSLLASMSRDLTVFILGWCLIQGFGAALMLPNVQTIIRGTLSGADRAKAYGTMAGVNALGAAMGPIIGGFLTTFFSWRWAFRLEVVSLLVIVVFNRLIPADQPITQRLKLDKMGVLLQAASMVSLVLGILLISDYGLFMAKKPLIIGDINLTGFLGLSPTVWLIGLGCILLLLFTRHERMLSEQKKPSLVQLSLFAIRDFVNGLKVRSIQVSILAGVLFTVPLFMQVSYGVSAFNTGLALLPLSISLIIGSILGVRLTSRYFPKQIIQAGAAILTLGALVMIAIMNTGTQPVDMAIGLTIIGFGGGLIASHIVNVILSSVAAKETAEASGVTSTLEQVGNSVGVAILGTVLTLALTMGVTQQLNLNTSLPAHVKQEAQQQIDAGLEVASDAQVRANILESYDAEIADQILPLYDAARTNAFRITMLVVAFFGLIMLIFSGALPKKQLTTVE